MPGIRFYFGIVVIEEERRHFRLMDFKISRERPDALLRLQKNLSRRNRCLMSSLYQGVLACLEESQIVNMNPPAQDSILERYRRYVETTSEGILEIDATGATTFSNPRMGEMLGYTTAEMQCTNAFDLIHPEDRAEAASEWERRLQGMTGNREWRLRRKDGSYVWVQSSATPIRNPEGKVVGSFALFTDITEKHQAQEALLQSELFNRSIIESSRDCMKVLDLNGRILSINTNGRVALGLDDHHEIVGKEWVSFWQGHDQVMAQAAICSALAGRSGRIVGSLASPDGSTKWWDVVITPILGKNGKPAQLLAVSRDVTELKQVESELLRKENIYKKSEQALQKSEALVARQFDELGKLEAQQRIILENLPVGVWFLDANGTMVYGNKAGKEIWRGARYVALDDLHVYKAWWHNTGEQLKAEDWAGARVVREKQSFLNQMLDIECFDGSRKTILNSAVPVQLEDGTFFGVVVFNLDVTDRAEAERALRESHSQLEQRVSERTAKLSETIGDLEAFSYSMSHDMRSPLRAMYGFSQALLTDYGDKLDETGLDFLRRIDRGAQRLDLLIRDVLSYSRISKADCALTKVNLDLLVQELVSHYPTFQEPHARVQVIGRLGSALGHEAFLSQVLSNLLSNAVKFTRVGNIPKIRIQSEELDGKVRISIEDNGIGIAPEHFDRVFAMFGRVYSDKEFEGTGIGLAIVRRAVERMGGEIGVESKVNQGSRFWFTLKSA